MERFDNLSYKMHEDILSEYVAGGQKEAHARQWLRGDNVDCWRHQRMYQLIDPILEFDHGATWLTVGDGRYGKDAQYLISKGGDVIASDISDALLKEAKAMDLIKKYSKENAEALSFPDAHFDYVFCKESYHHFPRPLVALYEMLRVAGKAVVLIEPNDLYANGAFPKSTVRILMDSLKLLLGRESGRHGFEAAGNYVFSVSRRELEKVALGLNYRCVAFKGINDFYLAGVEYEPIAENGILQKKVKALIALANLFCTLGLMDYLLLAAVIFKVPPSDQVRRYLLSSGYSVINLPRNPHVSHVDG